MKLSEELKETAKKFAVASGVNETIILDAMMIGSALTKKRYHVPCDSCGKSVEVERNAIPDLGIYCCKKCADKER